MRCSKTTNKMRESWRFGEHASTAVTAVSKLVSELVSFLPSLAFASLTSLLIFSFRPSPILAIPLVVNNQLIAQSDQAPLPQQHPHCFLSCLSPEGQASTSIERNRSLAEQIRMRGEGIYAHYRYGYEELALRIGWREWDQSRVLYAPPPVFQLVLGVADALAATPEPAYSPSEPRRRVQPRLDSTSSQHSYEARSGKAQPMASWVHTLEPSCQFDWSQTYARTPTMNPILTQCNQPKRCLTKARTSKSRRYSRPAGRPWSKQPRLPSTTSRRLIAGMLIDPPSVFELDWLAMKLIPTTRSNARALSYWTATSSTHPITRGEPASSDPA
ncbi:hypothetical protein BKA70DRAFT_1220714 [Coprinopsis sp. MPI-PUGE-AT-0042]|nr:hypothetical protein BKA70DRAFT_1220714 [Coprinopsis sp. MPI-PUGE-AT-0042]